MTSCNNVRITAAATTAAAMHIQEQLNSSRSITSSSTSTTISNNVISNTVLSSSAALCVNNCKDNDSSNSMKNRYNSNYHHQYRSVSDGRQGHQHQQDQQQQQQQETLVKGTEGSLLLSSMYKQQIYNRCSIMIKSPVLSNGFDDMTATQGESSKSSSSTTTCRKRCSNCLYQRQQQPSCCTVVTPTTISISNLIETLSSSLTNLPNPWQQSSSPINTSKHCEDCNSIILQSQQQQQKQLQPTHYYSALMIRLNNTSYCESNNNNDTSTSTTTQQFYKNEKLHDQDDDDEDDDDVEQQQQQPSRTSEALKQLFCGGTAGAVAKTITAPFSRLTILFQVHSLVTTKEHRPYFAMSISGGVRKIIERGGFTSLWRGNLTSVLHRFPYSAINFYCYENIMDILATNANNNKNNNNNNNNTGQDDMTLKQKRQQQQQQNRYRRQQEAEATKQGQLVRRMTRIVLMNQQGDDDDDDDNKYNKSNIDNESNSNNNTVTHATNHNHDNTPAMHRFLAGAIAGTVACTACYPLDLVRTRLTTELEGHEHYRGMVDAFSKIIKTEGFLGFYSGLTPTLLVAVPNFGISYTVYGTLKEHMLDDELFYNLRRIDADSGEEKLGYVLTLVCGAASGILATLVTFPMDTVRRRMQVQTLHVPQDQQLTSYQTLHRLIAKEGLQSLYRGLKPELLKVIPMVGSMFFVYEYTKDLLNI